MKLKTLIENQYKLEIAEVEIEMIPGIPQIHFLGLPDKAIKESFFRIKSALKSCGYQFPVSQQIIVNIKPSYLKKSSKGLELAVALGILHLTQQKELRVEFQNSIIYGELELDGRICEPNDLVRFWKSNLNLPILSGAQNKRCHSVFRLEKLDFVETFDEVDGELYDLERPKKGLEICYSEDEAELLFLMSTTGFHTLVAGASGFGKSTLARHYISFLKEPEKFERQKLLGDWRPLVAPHFSMTPAAFLGGGQQLYQGEVERAQGGILLLDELLEFNSAILESLRGPMTGEKLRISRGGVFREVDCHFQVVATTNLCPCGKWVPKQIPKCRFNQKKCRSYLDRLSGPIIDRFGLLFFYPATRPQRKIKGTEILLRIEEWQQSYKVYLTNQHDVTTEKASENQKIYEGIYPDLSLRRFKALQKVAEVYAVERESGSLQNQDYLRAEKWTISPFLQLEKGIG